MKQNLEPDFTHLADGFPESNHEAISPTAAMPVEDLSLEQVNNELRMIGDKIIAGKEFDEKRKEELLKMQRSLEPWN